MMEYVLTTPQQIVKTFAGLEAFQDFPGMSYSISDIIHSGSLGRKGSTIISRGSVWCSGFQEVCKLERLCSSLFQTY
jgi:hypothetical protein